ncbi:MAG: aspartate aminotransferase family protein, partial [Limisphaerales bacterium]
IAALEALKSGEVHQKLESLGARLEKGMTEAAQEAGLPMTFQRSGSMFCGYFGDHTVRNLSDAMACDRDRFKPYFHAMLENGVYVAPSAFEAGFISAAHTFEDIDATVEAARKALKHAA